MLNDEQLKSLLDGFKPWVASKDPSDTYFYSLPKECAFAQYLHSLGYDNCEVGPFDFNLDENSSTEFVLPFGIERALNEYSIEPHGSNFGNLLIRLEKAGM